MAPPISLKKGGLQQWAVLFNRLQRCLGGGWLASALSLPRCSPQPKAAQGLLQSPTGALDAVGAWPCPSARGHLGARGHTTRCFSLSGYAGDRWGLLFTGRWSAHLNRLCATVTLQQALKWARRMYLGALLSVSQAATQPDLTT